MHADKGQAGYPTEHWRSWEVEAPLPRGMFRASGAGEPGRIGAGAADHC
jgi:hypothetical protein